MVKDLEIENKRNEKGTERVKTGFSVTDVTQAYRFRCLSPTSLENRKVLRPHSSRNVVT